jgi:hypothetical protein
MISSYKYQLRYAHLLYDYQLFNLTISRSCKSRPHVVTEGSCFTKPECFASQIKVRVCENWLIRNVCIYKKEHNIDLLLILLLRRNRCPRNHIVDVLLPFVNNGIPYDIFLPCAEFKPISLENSIKRSAVYY